MMLSYNPFSDSRNISPVDLELGLEKPVRSRSYDCYVDMVQTSSTAAPRRASVEDEKTSLSHELQGVFGSETASTVSDKTRPSSVYYDSEESDKTPSSVSSESNKSVEAPSLASCDSVKSKTPSVSSDSIKSVRPPSVSSSSEKSDISRPSSVTPGCEKTPPTSPFSEKTPLPSTSSEPSSSSSSSEPSSSTTPNITPLKPPTGNKSKHKRGDSVETCGYPEVPDPIDPARVLNRKDLTDQRVKFLGAIVLLNILMTVTAIFGTKSKIIFCTILFIKSKDFLSSIISPLGLFFCFVRRLVFPQPPVPQQWILSLIPAYSESEEQIVKTIFSLRDNGVEPHRQVMVVILDGNPRDVKGHMTRVITSFERPYISFKWKRGVLRIIAGFMEDVPVIVLEKLKNGGKKDSLILCHDLFNYSRDNTPLYTQLLREEMWDSVLPTLLAGEDFTGFNMVFCTDADSTIYKGAIAKLANALARDKNAIAACGLVLVELEPGYEWSFWNLYQQFQYSFGQYVRRRAEHFLGKVTCLPGCITMVAVREEMGGAIKKYAEPITGYLVLSHQVQYLGTDRRLTYSMLSQGKHLTTLFVPDAVSETVAPQSITHYLSQRRRWGSNAYFNNYFYLGGEKMIPLTRIAATIEVVRLSLVYYRVLNTVLFIKGLSRGVVVIDLLPMLIIGQMPTFWFFCSVMLEKELRMRGHKLFLGFCINKCISPFMSMIIFTKVATNLGSQAWGMSGVTASSAAAPAAAEPSNDASDLSAAERGEAGVESTPGSKQQQAERRRSSESFRGVSIEC